MQSDWLVTSSLEQSHQIISAINILSIDAKFRLAGVPSTIKEKDINMARDHLIQFLDRLQELLDGIEGSKDQIVLGANPRIGQFALDYLSDKKRKSRQSNLYGKSVDDIRGLLKSADSADIELLISCLEDLRVLLEQHSYADIHHLLGEL